MNEHAFDRMMTDAAHRNPENVPVDKLDAALARLGRATAPRPRRAALPHRRALTVALAMLLLLCASAVAATMGLSHFLERNPYAFSHQPDQSVEDARLSPLTLLDESELSLLRVSPIDSAWIDGRLTLSVLVASADADVPLLAGELNGDGTANLYADTAQPPTLLEDAQSARILHFDDISLYTLPGEGDGWSGYATQTETSPQDGGTLLAIECNPDFVSASELDALAEDGRFPLRLELYVSDRGTLRAQAVTLSAALPDENEKEMMVP